MTELEKYRQEIDEVDKILAASFEKRMEIVSKMAHYKEKNNIQTYDPQREKEMLKRNCTYINNENIKKYYPAILEELLKQSKLYQQEIRENKKAN